MPSLGCFRSDQPALRPAANRRCFSGGDQQGQRCAILGTTCLFMVPRLCRVAVTDGYPQLRSLGPLADLESFAGKACAPGQCQAVIRPLRSMRPSSDGIPFCWYAASRSCPDVPHRHETRMPADAHLAYPRREKETNGPRIRRIISVHHRPCGPTNQSKALASWADTQCRTFTPELAPASPGRLVSCPSEQPASGRRNFV